MNGLGAKLVAAYSNKFIIETVCKGKKYTQVCENNLSNIKKPKIADSKKKDYTKISPEKRLWCTGTGTQWSLTWLCSSR